MKFKRYEPSWYSKSVHRLSLLLMLAIGFTLLVTVADKVAPYVVGFAVVFAAALLIYWATWAVARRRK